MFTIQQIEQAHQEVKSGADFPKYIQAIKSMGVNSFETWVIDNHTNYFGSNNFQINGQPKYEHLAISDSANKENFIMLLKEHQKGNRDFLTFCKDCAHSGIEKWKVNLENMTCTYYDKFGNVVLVENISKP